MKQNFLGYTDRYRLILENVNDIIWILNEKFKIQYVNENTVLRLLGYKLNDLIRKPAINYVHTDDIEDFLSLIKKEFKNRHDLSEIRYKHKEGHWVWFESKGKFYYNKIGELKWLIISRNITERKLAEEKYKNLFEKSPNAILLINFDGIILDANSTTKKLFGYDKEYFIGKLFYELKEIYLLGIKSYFKEIFKASFKSDFPQPREVKMKQKNGKFIWVNIQASLIKVGGNILIQFIFQDITKKKKAEILEKQFKNQLENEVKARTRELNKALNEQKSYFDQILKSSQFKTEFMSSMSHELRTPLNAIMGFTDLLLEGSFGQLNDKQFEFVKDIESSAEHQFDMVQHILDISKIESGRIIMNMQHFSLNNVVYQIKSTLKSLYKKKVLKFKVKGLETEKHLYADPIRFKEILYNLLSNAVKFTIEGMITVNVQEKYDQWLFKVNDTGIGIALKDYDLIFKEFKRVDSTYVRSVPGTGLGLSITKRLVELHGGDISFTSVLGVGTTFTFSIPKNLEKK